MMFALKKLRAVGSIGNPDTMVVRKWDESLRNTFGYLLFGALWIAQLCLYLNYSVIAVVIRVMTALTVLIV